NRPLPRTHRPYPFVSLSPASPTDDSIPCILDSAAAAAPRPPHPIRCRRLAHPSCSSPSGPALPLLHPAPCHPSESPHRPHPCCPRQRRAASSFSDSRCLLASHDGSVCAVRRPAVWTAAVSRHGHHNTTTTVVQVAFGIGSSQTSSALQFTVDTRQRQRATADTVLLIHLPWLRCSCRRFEQ
ncbi:unnamed protein product, partial [Urochloa humidicola]